MLDQVLFLERFAHQVGKQPDQLLFTYVDDKGVEVKKYTYKEFDDVTSKLASALLDPQGWALNVGQKVLLVYPPGLDFIVAFFACLKASLVAVPVYPPRPGLSKDLSMFVSVQSNCGATVALTNSYYNFATRAAGFKKFLMGSKLRWPELEWHVTDDSKVPSSNSSYTEFSQLITPASLAFFQYTSGSTAAPKGVMISHGNLAHNLSSIIYALNASESTVVVSWLPQYHDMGLIGSYLGIAYCGGSGYYMSPISFIKRPVLWLEMISKYQATHIQAPNFAYKLSTRKWKECEEKQVLNFSSLQHLFNAAEPIDADTIDNFNATFAQYGLCKSAFSPGYGLAEHTVYVCDRGEKRVVVDRVALEKDRKVVVVEDASDPSKAHCIVGCGNPHRFSDLSGIQVRIVDADTCQALEEDNVGEIWVSSPSKATGYYNLDQKTKRDFHGKLVDENSKQIGNESWLRTGDLGFLHETELFVCGRIKDLIIIRGRNHYPQDIEHSVEQASEQVRPGCVAAFTTTGPSGDGEVLGIVAEIKDAKTPGLEDISKIIRQRVTSEHGVVPYVVVIIKDRTIPKTTSGKISRFRVKAAFQNAELSELHRWVGDIQRQEDQEAKLEVDAEEAAAKEADDTSNKEPPREAQNLVTIASGNDPKVGGKPTGAALLGCLKEEVARLIEGDPSTLDESAALIHVGMDSMALTQFRGILQTTYETDISEMELFDEETTLKTVCGRVEGNPPAAKFLEDGAASSGQVVGDNARQADSAPTMRVKQRKKKQSLFGCFKICGC